MSAFTVTHASTATNTKTTTKQKRNQLHGLDLQESSAFLSKNFKPVL
jgi:hypothetical protein